MWQVEVLQSIAVEVRKTDEGIPPSREKRGRGAESRRSLIDERSVALIDQHLKTETTVIRRVRQQEEIGTAVQIDIQRGDIVYLAVRLRQRPLRKLEARPPGEIPRAIVEQHDAVQHRA